MSEQLYADAITAESEGLLRRLRRRVPEAVVLGGWAVYLYARGQRSKDVDIAVLPEGLGALREEFGAALRKNTNLRKYEVVLPGGIELDILVAYYSNPGIAIEHVLGATVAIGGYRVLRPEPLLVLKLCALNDCAARPKGMKDEMDILSLLASTTIDWTAYRAFTTLCMRSYQERMPGIVGRLLISADLRKTWSRVLKGGGPAYPNEHAWRTWLEAFRRPLLKDVPTMPPAAPPDQGRDRDRWR